MIPLNPREMIIASMLDPEFHTRPEAEQAETMRRFRQDLASQRIGDPLHEKALKIQKDAGTILASRGGASKG